MKMPGGDVNKNTDPRSGKRLVEYSEGVVPDFRPLCPRSLVNRRLFLGDRGCATALVIATRAWQTRDGLRN